MSGIEELAKPLLEAIRKTIAASVASLRADVDRLTRHVEALAARAPQRGEPGKDADPVDYEQVGEALAVLVSEAVSKLPPATPGKDGTSVSVDEVQNLVRDAVAALPPPKDGVDGKSVEEATVRAMLEPLVAETKTSLIELVRSTVSDAVAAIPPAPPGKDAAPVDYDAVAERIRTSVADAVDALPPPKDGKDGKDAEPVDQEALAALVVERVREAVDAAVAAIPPAPPGKDAAPVDYETIRAHIDETVQQLVDALPKPKDGADATVDYDRIDARLKELVAALPPPKDGKDAAAVDYEAIHAKLGELVAALPRAKDGEPGPAAVVDYDVIFKRVEEQARELVAAIPKPKDAEPIDYDRIDARLKELVAAIPKPKDGADAAVDYARIETRLAELVTAIPRPSDGRDALAVDVLDLDVTRGYPRGTFVRWAGGLLRAFRATDPLEAKDEAERLEKFGWEVCLNGIAGEAEETLNEGRLIRRTTTYTDGSRFVRELRTSCIVNRGVYRDEHDYERGDVVTSNGSSWHAEKPSRGVRPGSDPETWKLMVKEGRPGKDGKNAPTPTPVRELGS